MAYWFNSRFVVLLAPLLMVFVGIYISRQPRKIAENRLAMAGVILSLFVFYLIVLPFSAVVTMADAVGGFSYGHTPFAVQMGEKLGGMYSGNGSIMLITGSAQEHRIYLASGIALRNYDSIIESSTWKQSFSEPWKHGDKLIVIAKQPDSDAVSVVKYWNEHRSTLANHYQLVFEDDYYELWRMN
jgi:hypothetical protein